MSIRSVVRCIASWCSFLPPVRRWGAVAVVGALCLAAGCKKAAPTSASGLFPVVLQTDWYPQPEQGGFYEALLKGYYKGEGLDVTITPGGPYVVAEQQVSTGAAQFAMGTSDQVLVKASRGLPLVAVAATMQMDPQCVMVHAESPVKTFAELNGHAIAVKPGSIWFEYLVKRFNLSETREIPATYSVANFLKDPNYIQQCFVTSEPFFAEKGGAKVRTLLVSDTGYRPYRVFFTSQTFSKEHPEIVAKFVRASLKGWRAFLADPTATEGEIGKLNPALSPEQMAFSVKTLTDGHFVTGDPDRFGQFAPERWATMEKQLEDLKVITSPVDPTTAYTARFLPR
jgi:NitT/TauT family transport system substrate-binding protein